MNSFNDARKAYEINFTFSDSLFLSNIIFLYEFILWNASLLTAVFLSFFLGDSSLIRALEGLSRENKGSVKGTESARFSVCFKS